MPSLKDLKDKRRQLSRLIRQAEKASGKTAADIRNERQAVYAAEARAVSSTVHNIPDIVDQQRRQSCRDDLKRFFELYFPHVFTLQWSVHHLRLIELVQRAILEGLQQAIGFPRGSGKTTICQYALVWAMLNGHSRFGLLVAADKAKAARQMSDVVTELTRNTILLDDFPEVIVPLRASEGMALKARNQRLDGNLTRLEVSTSCLITPTIPQTVAAGNDERIIQIGTITGATRGALVRNFRPDFVLIDDPQTRKSAKSPLMTSERSDIINGDLMAMAGPGKTLSALMTCTVIYKGDLADKHLDRQEHPEWHGIRVKMLESMPTETKLWDEWSDIVRDCQQNDLSLDAAHKFYRKHRKKMDSGAQVYWEHRVISLVDSEQQTKVKFESALESAMYLYYRNPAVFASEYQNEPLELDSDESMPAADVIRKQRHTAKRYVVPLKADTITAFVDIQKRILPYVVVAWQKSTFTGWIIDYGSWPDQKRRFYTRDNAKNTIGHQKRGASFDVALRNALEKLLLGMLRRSYLREDGVELRLERGLIDANWAESTDVVYSFLKEMKLSPTWMPSHGIGIRATQRALNDRQSSRRSRDKRGVHWVITKQDQYKLERLAFDANWWKSFHAQRWQTTPGDRGSLSLFSGHEHEMFAEHLTAEYGIQAEARGRKVTEWFLKPGSPDNDFLDCMVGNCVAASMLGATVATIEAMVPKDPTARPKISASNIGQFYG